MRLRYSLGRLRTRCGELNECRRKFVDDESKKSSHFEISSSEKV